MFDKPDPECLRERKEVSCLLAQLSYRIVGANFDARYFRFEIQKNRKKKGVRECSCCPLKNLHLEDKKNDDEKEKQK